MSVKQSYFCEISLSSTEDHHDPKIKFYGSRRPPSVKMEIFLREPLGQYKKQIEKMSSHDITDGFQMMARQAICH